MKIWFFGCVAYFLVVVAAIMEMLTGNSDGFVALLILVGAAIWVWWYECWR